jgi:type IV pilus assembly protein PilW
MKTVDSILNSDSGFTLIELLIGILISGILATSIFSIYMTQQQAAGQVENMSAMQQNLRSALRLMEREIRMAGCDPTLSGNDAIVQANADSFQFQFDIRGDAATDPPDGNTDNGIEPNEDITYSLAGTDLMRNNVIIAENVRALDFVYLDESGAVLNPAVNPGGPVDLALGLYENVQTVQVSLLVEAPLPERDFVNNRSYTNLQGVELLAPQGDRIRRLMAVSSIRIRNL